MLPVEAQRNSDVSWVAIAKKVFLDIFFRPADVGGISILFAHKTGSSVLYIFETPTYSYLKKGTTSYNYHRPIPLSSWISLTECCRMSTKLRAGVGAVALVMSKFVHPDEPIHDKLT